MMTETATCVTHVLKLGRGSLEGEDGSSRLYCMRIVHRGVYKKRFRGARERKPELVTMISPKGGAKIGKEGIESIDRDGLNDPVPNKRLLITVW